jgi:hypothetical protein
MPYNNPYYRATAANSGGYPQVGMTELPIDYYHEYGGLLNRMTRREQRMAGMDSGFTGEGKNWAGRDSSGKRLPQGKLGGGSGEGFTKNGYPDMLAQGVWYGNKFTPSTLKSRNLNIPAMDVPKAQGIGMEEFQSHNVQGSQFEQLRDPFANAPRGVQGVGMEGYQQNIQAPASATSQMNASLKSRPKGNNPFFQKAGKVAGGIAAGAEGLMTGIGQAVDTHNQLQAPIDYFNDMKFSNAETMVNGVPSYGGVSEIGSEVGAIDAEAASRGMGLTGFKGGAAAGSSIGGAVGGIAGSAIAGVGAVPLGAIGAGVGAVVGGTVGWIKGMTKKGKADKAAYEAQIRGRKKFNLAQNQYNEDVGDYYDTVDENRQDTQGERNRAKRQYGLASYNDPFKSIV